MKPMTGTKRFNHLKNVVSLEFDMQLLEYYVQNFVFSNKWKTEQISLKGGIWQTGFPL